MRAGEHVEHECEIAHRAGDEPEMDEVVEGFGYLAVRDQAEGGLEPEGGGAGGRQARRGARVGRECERPEPRRDRDRSPAARAAGAIVEMPRIARDAEERRIGQELVGEFRRRRFADDDGTRGLEALDRDRVAQGHVLRHETRAPGGADALGIDDVLDRDRHAVKRAPHFPAGKRRLGRLCRGERLIAADGDVGVECRLARLDAGKNLPHQCDRRELARAELPRELACRTKGEAGVGHGIHAISLLAAGARVAAKSSVARRRNTVY